MKWFSDERGYGYLLSDAGDVFVRWSDIEGDHEPFKRNLTQGDQVEFDCIQGERGLRAQNVKITAPGTGKARRSVWQTLADLERRIVALEKVRT